CVHRYRISPHRMTLAERGLRRYHRLRSIRLYFWLSRLRLASLEQKKTSQNTEATQHHEELKRRSATWVLVVREKGMPDTVPQFSLSVGDRVVYPNQGVCRVSAVEAKEVAGQTLTFVTMKREEDGAVVMVPQAKVHSIGLRRVASAQDVN